MISSPDVSVVLPFRNGGETLQAAIASLQLQTFSRFECVLVDHHSSDGSLKIAEDACRADRRFRIIRGEGSFVDALNTGCGDARGNLIARMDADDLAAPRRLEAQYAMLTDDPALAVASCLVAAFPEETLRDGMRRYVDWSNSLDSPEQIRNAVFVESPLIHPSITIRRSALHAVGGYVSSDGPEDYDLWLRLLLAGYRVAKVADVLLHWRDSATRLTRTDAHYSAQRIFEMKLRYLPRLLPPGTVVQICGAGPIGRRWGRALHAMGYRVRRFVDVDTNKQGRIIGGTTVEPPDTLNPADGFVLSAVGALGARAQVESYLQTRGFRPWQNYVAVA